MLAMRMEDEQVKMGHDKGIINKIGGLVEKSKKAKMGFPGVSPRPTQRRRRRNTFWLVNEISDVLSLRSEHLIFPKRLEHSRWTTRTHLHLTSKNKGSHWDENSRRQGSPQNKPTFQELEEEGHGGSETRPGAEMWGGTCS